MIAEQIQLNRRNDTKIVDFTAARSFYGREKENLIYPIALANLMLHGIDEPRLWHGNTLTGGEIYGSLFRDAPGLFDVVLTNPPFGGKKGREAQTSFADKTTISRQFPLAIARRLSSQRITAN